MAAPPLTIGISMGDPAGIGPEIIVKALTDPEIAVLARFIVFGSSELLAYAADQAELDISWRRISHDRFSTKKNGGFCELQQHRIVVVDYDEYGSINWQGRKPTKVGGQAAMQFVLDAVQDALDRHIDAVVTGPIHKTSWQMAGYRRWPGHTELLKEKCRVKRVTMLFAGGPLRVGLASIHLPLFELRDRFTIGLVFDPIDMTNDALREWFGIESPRIGVCGLNPHAGENGTFGDEEQRIIKPAVVMAQNSGINALGPFSADTLFQRAANKEFDAVIAMYHDQGLIPVKLLAFEESVNITLGLPIVRTSVDHGTAFDIVGRNKAQSGSMKSAIRMAVQIAQTRVKNTATMSRRVRT